MRALLFGVDGTLADTERDGHRPAFNQAFADAGLAWQWDVALYGRLLAVTGGKERIKHCVDRFRPDNRKPRRFEERVAELHRAKTRHYAAIAARGGVPMRPGVKRLLAEARAAGMRLAIATTTAAENVTVLLDHSLGAGTQAWFEVIVAGAAPVPMLMRSTDYPGALRRRPGPVDPKLPERRGLPAGCRESSLPRRVGTRRCARAAWITYDMAAHGHAPIVSGVGFPVHFATHVAAGRIANECTSH